MFGIGGSEILVILVIALLFLGPDKLPDAAKTISKGIRDLKKQSRALQNQIESDEKIGGAIRDLKSALRGEDAPRPPVRLQATPAVKQEPAVDAAAVASTIAAHDAAAAEQHALEAAKPSVTLPETAGEAADVVDDAPETDVASFIKPAAGTVAKQAEPPADDEPKQKHG